VLSADEQQVWEDIQRHYDAEVEEPARPGRHPTSRGGPGGRRADELPLTVVAGSWITVFLMIFGEFDFALVIGTAVALRWALWRWWPHGDRGPIPASPSGAAADGVDQSWIASWPPV
jgi:hypothetical protein